MGTGFPGRSYRPCAGTFDGRGPRQIRARHGCADEDEKVRRGDAAAGLSGPGLTEPGAAVVRSHFVFPARSRNLVDIANLLTAEGLGLYLTHTLINGVVKCHSTPPFPPWRTPRAAPSWPGSPGAKRRCRSWRNPSP